MKDMLNLRSIQSRLLFMFVGLILLSVSIVAFLSISTIIQTGQEATVAGGVTLRAQAEEFLLNLSVASAKLDDQELERIRKDAASVAAYATNVFDHPEAFNSKGYWVADDHMVFLLGGQYSNSGGDVASAWVPNFVRVDERTKSRLEQMAYLDFIFAPVHNSNPDIVAIYMITAEGATRVYPNINLGGIIEPSYNMVEAIFHSIGTPQNDPQREVVWTPVYDDPAGQGLLVTAVAPVYSEMGGFEGTIGIDVTLKNLIENIETASPVAGGYSFLIDQNGRAIALPDQGYIDLLGREHAKGEFGTELNDVRAPLAPVLTSMKNGETGFRSIQVDNRELFIAYAPMPSTGWSLAHVVEAKNMLQVVNDLQAKQDASTEALIWRRLLPVGLLILLVAAGLAVLAARHVIRPIHALAATAQAIQAGDLNHRAQPAGLKELDTLAHTFNNMTARLREVLENLEDKVRERTAQLADANQEILALNEKLKGENLRLSTELEVTQRLQRMILPKQHELLEIDGLEIAGYMEPADEVGGDYYDVLHHNGHVKIGIGDVTGHGLESGVLMLMTQMGVRTLLTQNETDPVHFLDILNRTIYDNVQRMQIDKNLTLALLDYVADPQGGGQLKASGQHEELILVRRGGAVELVNTLDLGFPIGLDNDIAGFVNQITLDLLPGDGVVLYTDGITEAENLAGEQYGMERLCAVISRHWAEPADAIKEAVIADLRQFIGTQTVFDDITLLVLKQK
jgi:phosphoserine phosphatase RsbU/P